MIDEACHSNKIGDDLSGKDFQVTEQSRDSSSIKVAFKTDIGRVRAQNEDCSLVLDLSENAPNSTGLLKLVAVADGLGGHAAGGTASRMAIDCLRDTFTGPMAARLSSRVEALSLLKKSFLEANIRVHSAGASPGKLRGMGTTLVAALVGVDTVDICNVGDSRAYILRKKNGLCQITKDHSWEAEYAEKFEGGTAELGGAGNLLTRALGPQREVEVDEFTEPLGRGETLVLCSDGLSRMIEHEDIQALLQGASSLESAVDELVAKANENGGEDNITVVLARAAVRSK